jgi:hypothetical protein
MLYVTDEFIDFKQIYNSVTREVMYNNLIELGVPMELIKTDWNVLRWNVQ